MIGPAFEKLVHSISENPNNYGISEPIKRDDLHIILRTPSVESATGRVFFDIYLRQSPKPILIAQTTSLVNNYPLKEINPYSPPFCREQLLDLAITPTGEIHNGERLIYWAKYLPWRSLKESFHDVEYHRTAINRINKPPWTPFREDEEERNKRLSEYLGMLQKICLLPLGLEKYKEEIAKQFEQHWDYLKWGFSHGDLWVQDIFRSEEGELCFLDWEWASPTRPAGLDLFHLGISAIEFGYRISTAEAVTCLIYGQGEIESLYRNELKMLWNELEYDKELRWLSIMCYLLFVQYRVSIQYPRLLKGVYLDAGCSFSMVASSREYLVPLIQ
jgi:hypothetical protein